MNIGSYTSGKICVAWNAAGVRTGRWYIVTPKELNKSMTILLDGLLADTGFSKKRIGRLIRRENGCQQFFVFYFTGMRFSNGCSLTGNLMFSFPEVDKLTARFLGEEYDKLMSTGLKPFYAVVPGQPILKYKYYFEEPLEQFVEMVANDFRLYAILFFEQFNTLSKLEASFDQMLKEGTGMKFSVRTGKQGKGGGCCIAAALCLLEEWEKLRLFLKETDLLLDEHRERIDEYVSDH